MVNLRNYLACYFESNRIEKLNFKNEFIEIVKNFQKESYYFESLKKRNDSFLSKTFFEHVSVFGLSHHLEFCYSGARINQQNWRFPRICRNAETTSEPCCTYTWSESTLCCKIDQSTKNWKPKIILFVSGLRGKLDQCRRALDDSRVQSQELWIFERSHRRLTQNPILICQTISMSIG